MPVGVTINALSVLFGGAFGGFLGNKLTEKFKNEITMIFGACSMGMGIYAIAPMKYMPAVIFALVFGTGIGLAIHLGDWINKGAYGSANAGYGRVRSHAYSACEPDLRQAADHRHDGPCHQRRTRGLRQSGHERPYFQAHRGP